MDGIRRQNTAETKAWDLSPVTTGNVTGKTNVTGNYPNVATACISRICNVSAISC